jgi:hypothetical protein
MPKNVIRDPGSVGYTASDRNLRFRTMALRGRWHRLEIDGLGGPSYLEIDGLGGPSYYCRDSWPDAVLRLVCVHPWMGFGRYHGRRFGGTRIPSSEAVRSGGREGTQIDQLQGGPRTRAVVPGDRHVGGVDQQVAVVVVVDGRPITAAVGIVAGSGENATCIGCHEDRSTVPGHNFAALAKQRPLPPSNPAPTAQNRSPIRSSSNRSSTASASNATMAPTPTAAST